MEKATKSHKKLRNITRITVDLNDLDVERINRVMDHFGSPSKADILRQLLRFLDAARPHVKHGVITILSDEGEKIKFVV